MSLGQLGLLLALGALWGFSFLFIKVGVSEIGPLTFSTLRVLVGAVALWLVVRARGTAMPRDRRTWWHLAVMGLFNGVIPFAAIGWGTQHIASGLSAILNATMPLFTFLFASAWGDERITPLRAAGVLLGFGGIVLLTWPRLTNNGWDAALWGQLAVVLGSISYAIAVVYTRRTVRHLPPLTVSLGQVGCALLMFLPLTLLESPWHYRPSAAAIGAAVGLGVLGTAVAYIIYYRLIQELGATSAALVTYIVPVFGVFWGWLLLAERLSWEAFGALGLILAGMLLVNGLNLRRALSRRSRARPAMQGGAR